MASEQGSAGSRKVLVTGARTGIGLEIALAFLRKGDQVVLASRSIEVESVAKSREELVRYVGSKQAILVQKDVSKVDECRSLVTEAVEALEGRLDVLVNNAGGTSAFSVQFEDLTAEQWRDDLALNLDSVFHITQTAIPHLKKSKGNIVNISSIGSMRAANVFLPYCVAKAGLDMLTKTIAVEYAAEGIRVNAINPGIVETEIFKHSGMDDDAVKNIVKSTEESYPLGRPGKPADIASLTLFLADNEAAGFITGQTIVIDGGKLLSQ